MFISRKFLNDIGNISKDTIKWAITVDTTIVLVNRNIDIDDQGNYIDNITSEEVQAGTQLVKEFCLQNNCMDLYFDYVLTVFEEPVERLDFYKEKKKYEINKIKEDSLKSILHKDTVFQTEPKDKDSIQRRISVLSKGETVNWLDIENKPVKFTDTEFKNFFKEVVNLEQQVILTAAQLKQQIEQCSSTEEVDNIVWPSNLDNK